MEDETREDEFFHSYFTEFITNSAKNITGDTGLTQIDRQIHNHLVVTNISEACTTQATVGFKLQNAGLGGLIWSPFSPPQKVIWSVIKVNWF